ncbi:actin related protein 2/3 complex [Tieghemostelium lacteum]|uniref:Actin-related protein 2/3 complex subunit 5 n=1 Tax=Tieghemostelium lacteum TaxID=361077 RepID=A0A152A6H4_TIELA|nr:actin related protein 2/3 complex [Tieghemostelium lacteum]|eukprot:KYR01824.1 actin related protein 2/3 complex [Tieghemostelium lacteum]
MSNYDEEQVETVVGGKSDAEYKNDIAAREREVTKALNGGRPQDALPFALSDPPVYTKTAAIKDANADIVIKLLIGFKEKDIDAAVDSLDSDQLDVLMKYIYRALGTTTETSSLLFKWHESTLKKGGLGAIMRVISEKKTV